MIELKKVDFFFAFLGLIKIVSLFVFPSKFLLNGIKWIYYIITYQERIKMEKKEVFVDVNTRNRYWKTPIMYSIENNKDEHFFALLDAKPDLNIPDSEGRTPLHLVVLKNNERMVKALILSGAHRDIPDKDGDTPLLIATRYGKSADIVNDLLYLKPASPDSLEQELNALTKGTKHTVIYL